MMKRARYSKEAISDSFLGCYMDLAVPPGRCNVQASRSMYCERDIVRITKVAVYLHCTIAWMHVSFNDS